MISLLELMLWQGNHFGVSESDYSLTPNEQMVMYIMAITSYIRWNDYDVHFVLVQHA